MPTSNAKELIIKITSKEDDKGFDAVKQSLKDLKMQQGELMRSLTAQDNQYNRDKSQQHNAMIRSLIAQDEKYKAHQKQLNEDLKKYDRDRLEATRRNAQINRQEAKDNKAFTGQVTNLGSGDALKQQQRHYQDLLNTLTRGTPIFNETEKRLNGITTALQGTSQGTKNLSADLLTVGASIVATYQSAKILFTFIADAVQKAADLEVYSKAFVEIAGSTEEATRQLNQLYTASAGNLNDTELVTYSNKMRLLGVDVERTTQLLDIIERQSDKVSIGFKEGESVLQSYLNTGRDRVLKDLALDAGDVRKEVEKLTLETGKTNEQLEIEDLKLIRLNAIINLYGDSLTNINQKQKDSGDRIKSLSTLYDKFVTGTGKEFLELFNQTYSIVGKTADQLNVLGNSLGVAQGKSNSFANTLIDVGKKIAIGMIFPITALIREIDFLVSEYEYAINKFATAKAGLDAEGTTNVDRPMNPKFDRNFTKIAKRGIGGEFIPDKKTGTGKTITEITNEVKELAKQIVELQKSQGITDPNTTLFALYIQQIDVLQNKINYLNSSFKDSAGLEFGTLPSFDNSTPINPIKLSDAEYINIYGKEKETIDPMAEWDKLKNTSSSVLSDTQNIMNVLGLGTDTFVSQLLNGFQSAVSLVSSLVNILAQMSAGGGGGILGSILGGIVSFIPLPGAGLAGQALGGRSNPDFSRFNGGRAGMGNNMRIAFSPIKFVQRGSDLHGTMTAYQTELNERRY